MSGSLTEGALLVATVSPALEWPLLGLAAIVGVTAAYAAYLHAHRQPLILAVAGPLFGAASSIGLAFGAAATLAALALLARLADARPWPSRSVFVACVGTAALAGLAHPVACVLVALAAPFYARLPGLLLVAPPLAFGAWWRSGASPAVADALASPLIIGADLPLGCIALLVAGLAVLLPGDPLNRDRRPLVAALVLGVASLSLPCCLDCDCATSLLAPLALLFAVAAFRLHRD